MLHTSNENLVYAQAIALCEVSGGHIAAFETRLEYESVKPHLVMPVQTGFWLYANDRRKESKFKNYETHEFHANL